MESEHERMGDDGRMIELQNTDKVQHDIRETGNVSVTVYDGLWKFQPVDATKLAFVKYSINGEDHCAIWSPSGKRWIS